MKKEAFKETINFTNSGELQFFFIGTGSAFSTKYFQNNLLIIKGSDHLLVDCGNICPYAMTTYNSNISSVKNVFITHSHADHIGGMEHLALAGKYITNNRPKVVITDEYKKILWEQSLKGGCAYGETSSLGKLFTFEDYFDQIKPVELKNTPRPMYEANVGSINLKIFRTQHIPSPDGSWDNTFYSTGILVDDRILFTGDARFDKDLLDYMESNYQIEAIFHDCQFYEGGVHAFIGELEKLPADIKSKMLLCHYGDNKEDFVDRVSKSGFAGFVDRGVYYTF